MPRCTPFAAPIVKCTRRLVLRWLVPFSALTSRLLRDHRDRALPSWDVGSRAPDDARGACRCFRRAIKPWLAPSRCWRSGSSRCLRVCGQLLEPCASPAAAATASSAALRNAAKRFRFCARCPLLGARTVLRPPVSRSTALALNGPSSPERRVPVASVPNAGRGRKPPYQCSDSYKYHANAIALPSCREPVPVGSARIASSWRCRSPAAIA